MSKSEFKKRIVELRKMLALVEFKKQAEVSSQEIDKDLYQISVELDNLRTENEN